MPRHCQPDALSSNGFRAFLVVAVAVALGLMCGLGVPALALVYKLLHVTVSVAGGHAG
jgi:hypothetical protein